MTSSAQSVQGGSLFAHGASDFDEEMVDTLLAGGQFRLLRIVSSGQSTPAGEWLDQDDDEWVVLVKGAAMIAIEGEDKTRALTPGEWLLLPAHCRHRVEWTAPDQPTVWLALHHYS